MAIRIVQIMVMTSVLVLPAVGRAGPEDIGTATTVQGELKDSAGQPLEGSADFQLEVCDAFGNPTGQTVTILDVILSNGRFTLVPDFGSGTFDGKQRRLKVSVRYPHDPTDTQQYELLNPPIDIKPTPEAINSQQAQKVQLPLNQVGNDTQSLVSIENQSTDPNSAAIEGRSEFGKAARFFAENGAAVDASTSDGTGLDASSVGTGNALVAQALGTEGAAGLFIVGTFAGELPSTNSFPAINAISEGTGDAGRFTQANEDSDVLTAAVRGIANGFGSAGVFSIEFPPNFNTSPALRATTEGDGAAGHFEVINPDNPENAIYATSNAVTGGLARFETAAGTTGIVDAVTIDATSTRHALRVNQHGPFEAVHFECDNPANFAPVVYAQQLAGGGTVADLRNLSTTVSDIFLAFNQNGRVGFFGGQPAEGLPMFWIQNTPSAPGTTLLVQGEVSLGNTTVGTLSAGNTDINGNLCANTVCAQVKNFHIDHPLDPENKYLFHASVESNELKTVYDGTVELDARGEATIDLPDWFEALNGNFRYQLTPIGAAAPELHVSRPVRDNQFSISGGKPNMTISWQVTGVRHDAYATARPLVVEVEKPADERGTYLDPGVFGQPASKWVRAAEWQRRAAELVAAEAALAERLERGCDRAAAHAVAVQGAE